jgi:hypothetical protein
VVLDLVKALEGEPGELDLADRLEPVEGHAHRGADDGGLRERAVHHARAAELAVEILGDPEDAAVHAHVLADHEHVGIALHLLQERQVQRLHHVQLGHERRCPLIGGLGGPSSPSGWVASPSRAAISARCASSAAGGLP